MVVLIDNYTGGELCIEIASRHMYLLTPHAYFANYDL